MKCCSKCGNNKLIEGVRFCLNCGADVNTNDVKESVNKKVNKGVKENVNKNGKNLVRTRLSVELFEII